MTFEIVTTAKEASLSKHLPVAFEWAEGAVAQGLEGESGYISPTKAPGGWRVDLRNEDGEFVGYVRVEG